MTLMMITADYAINTNRESTAFFLSIVSLKHVITMTTYDCTVIQRNCRLLACADLKTRVATYRKVTNSNIKKL